MMIRGTPSYSPECLAVIRVLCIIIYQPSLDCFDQALSRFFTSSESRFDLSEDDFRYIRYVWY